MPDLQPGSFASQQVDICLEGVKAWGQPSAKHPPTWHMDQSLIDPGRGNPTGYFFSLEGSGSVPRVILSAAI